MNNIYNYLWFIPAIITLYIIFPIYYKQFLKSSNKVIFTATITILWVLLSIILSNVIREDLYGFINRIPVFLIGILCGWLTQNKKIHFTKSIYLLLFVNLIIGLILAYLTNYKNLYILVPASNSFLPNLLISTSLPFLMAKTFDVLRDLKISKLVIKILTFYGTFSLELYCVQELITLVILQNYNIDYGVIIFNLLNLFIITIYGYALFILNKYFWISIETLSTKLKKNK